MIESPQQFGPDKALVGVFTQPDRSGNGPYAGTALILFNAGVLPRIGPHRLNVKLARAAAAAGMASLRFDLSGQGDSRGGGGTGDYLAQAVSDIRAAMDHVEATHGICRFVVLGICSGAVNAYWTALADSRVAGVLLFDGYWYRSRWTRLVRNWKRAKGQTWPARFGALGRRLFRVRGDPAVEERQGGIFDEGTAKEPTADEFASSMQKLVDRGVSVQIVYSGSVIDCYSYSGQFVHVFGRYPFSRRVTCSFCPDIDHTFVTIEGQIRMIQLTLDWATTVATS